ncbi:MAG: hypothetical protein KGJ10_00695 [Acidobacteriota bacterium]|nr:hypothetical protein [Acidobacteriota bacterium]
MGPWAGDRLGSLLAIASLFVGLCVCQFVARQFEGESRRRRILAASLATIGGVVATDLAQSLSVLVACWMITSALTVTLLRVSQVTRTAGSSARNAALTFVTGDSVLLLATVSTYALHGGPTLTANSFTPVHGVSGILLLMAGTLAAVARAGLTVRSSWVTATINAPTSTSALLHAGVVNAGALLLWRLHEMAGGVAAIDAALAIICGAVLVALAPKIHARVDLKGQLATSTVSQMAFMLLAMALGFPVLAISHLIGHGVYKASRFMSAGGAIEQRARLRRRLDRGRRLEIFSRGVGAVGLLGVALLVGTRVHPEGLAAMGVFGPAAAVVWWLRTKSPIRGPLVTWLAEVAMLIAYAWIVSMVGQFLRPDAVVTGTSPWWSLGVVTTLVALRSVRRERAATLKTSPSTARALRAQSSEDWVAA